MGADSDWVMVQRKDIQNCKPGKPIPYRVYKEEKVSIPKLMILTVFCFSVIYLIWG
jgi:hypothetical protein